METKEATKILICDSHDKKIPLIWTFAFNGSEYWCPACGRNGGMFGTGIRVPSTKKLRDLLYEWEKKSEEFLDAKSTLVCYSKKINGKDVLREDLPKEEIDRCKKIVSEWKYKIKDQTPQPMKTTLDHFNEIKCPIVRRRAIRNCDEPEKQESSLKWAIHGGFVWRETPEGVAYWSEVYENPLAPSPEHLLPDGYREGAEPNLTEAFKELRETIGSHWDKIDCVCSELGRSKCELNCDGYKEETPSMNDALEKKTKELQDECHALVDIITKRNKKCTHQDATNVFLFKKPAEIEIKIQSFPAIELKNLSNPQPPKTEQG